MIVSSHQPNYLPWQGFFYKMMSSDIFVIMDSCQFPRGRSFVNRNRIKTPPSNFLWLTIPVLSKGRGLQIIKEVEIDNAVNWSRKHLESFFHFYKRAPYFKDYIGFFREIYSRRWSRLVELNKTIIRFFVELLEIGTEIYLLSELGIDRKATNLLLNIAKATEADIYLSASAGMKYIDEHILRDHGIDIKYYNFNPPVYPQLWGDFLYNLSIIDLVFNCGGKAKDVIIEQNRIIS